MQIPGQYWVQINIIMTDVVPAFAGQFYFGVLAPEKFEWAIDYYAEIIERFLRGIDAHLADSEFFLPSGYCVTDVLMYATAASSASRTPDGLAAYANIARWADQVGQRDAVKRGMAASGSL